MSRLANGFVWRLPFADPGVLGAYRAFERAVYENLADAKAA